MPPGGQLAQAVYNLKFTAKQLNRQSAKAGKEEEAEKNKLKKAIQQGHRDIAQIHAENAIRKQNEKLNLLRLASRVDAVRSKVETANNMSMVTDGMKKANRSMDFAMKRMNPGEITAVMAEFEDSMANMAVTTAQYEDATKSTTAVDTPQDAVDALMGKVADEAGVELTAEMNAAEAPKKITSGPNEVEEDLLGERLRALRA